MAQYTNVTVQANKTIYIEGADADVTQDASTINVTGGTVKKQPTKGPTYNIKNNSGLFNTNGQFEQENPSGTYVFLNVE